MSTQVVAWGTQPELSPVPSAPQPLVWLSLARPGLSLGQRCVPSALVCGARGFLYLCLCTNVYSNQSVLKTHAGAGRGAAATLQAPQAQLRRARLGQARPLGPQHCACHRRPLSETRACPCRPGLRPPPLGPNTVPSQHLSELDLGPFCPLGLCQSVTRDWADPGTPQSTAQAVPDGSASAFQLPGHLVPCAGPCPEDTSCRNTPAQARGRVGVGVSLTNPQTFQTPLITDTCAQQ